MRKFNVIAALLTVAMLMPLLSQAQLNEGHRLIDSATLTATASSSTQVNYPPSNALDGDTGSIAWITDSPLGQWFQLDAGFERWLSAIAIYAAASRIKDYEVYVAAEPNPADWGTPVASGNLPDTTAWHPITFPPTYGRYLRLEILSRHGSRTYIYEARLYESAFEMASLITGHRSYANSNVVAVSALPLMTGYDSYQISHSVSEPVSGWLPYDPNNPPSGLETSLGAPAEGEAVTRYAWFKDDANNELPTINYPATITYIRDTTDLIARAIPTISVPTWGDAQPADIRAHNINDDSSATIGIHKLEISVTPNLDLATNDQSRVLIRDTGSFSLTLTAIDNAGNSDTDTCALTVVNGATGLTTVWTGNGDGNDWHDNDNWSNYAPSPDATAWITNSGAAVTLKSSSPLLHSLVISNNATLTFKNWQTKLTATTMTIGHKGKLSCIGPFRNNEMSNRVWVAAHNFTLASGGTIDLVGKGYAGGLPFEDGHGPGGGKTGGTGAAAASHGGLGGIGYSKEKNGPLYGNAREPLAPGSGGGGGGASNGFGPGSDGGGAVLIEASGSVVIDGAIMANATHVAASTRGGGASGGSVYIVCSTFSGADGTISASGGNAPFWGGGGGGGRIAIVPTNMIAQATLPPHRVTFAAHRGLCTQARARDGALGSLYLPGTALIDGPFMPHTGVIDIPDWESWSVDSLAVSGWLQISNSTPFFELEVAHDFTIDGANAHWELQWPRITVGGNMVITNGGQLSLACAVSNAVTHAAYGALIDVAHNLTIAAGAWLRPQSAGFDGNSLHICASNLYVLASGGINADNLGFMYGYNAAGYDPHGYGPGHGYAAGSSGSGAGYGGRGGRSAHTELRGDIYGSDILPDLPGSGGGAHLLGVNSRGGSGGGFIWINVQDKALIDGSLTANGQKGIRNGGGSGGAIHLHCRDFSGGLSGILSAKGGDTYDTTYNGGGGGGRIAIWSGQPYFPAISKSRLVISEVAPDSFSGTVSVKEGLSYPSETHYSEPGTIRFIHVKHPAGTMVLVR